MSLIYSFDVINLVVLDPASPDVETLDSSIILWITASAFDAAAVNSNGTNRIVANSICAFFINSKPSYINGPRRLLKNPLNWILLENWVFDNSVSTDELFAKAYYRPACLSVDERLYGKKNLSVPIIRHDNHKVTPVVFFCCRL